MGGHGRSLYSGSDLALCPPPSLSLLTHASFLPDPAVSPGLELCDPTQRLRVALAGELVGVGGHFLFLGLALVSKDWRFLQRMITAPCILFLFYGSVSPFTCSLATLFSPSSLVLALARRLPLLHCPLSRSAPASAPQRGGISHSRVKRWETSRCTHAPLPPAGLVCFWSLHGG